MTLREHRRATKPDPDADGDPLTTAVLLQERASVSMAQRALERRDVALAFQPIVSSQHVSAPAFHEGLIRIYDETGRIIPASAFISSVEGGETGRQIDTVALELGLSALERDPGLRLAINMSARSIGYLSWQRVLERGLSARGGLAGRLILEISEASAMQLPEITGAFMRDLQKVGVTFALDDFGAGQTSFALLRDLYFDIFKIDGSYVRGIDRAPANQIVVMSMTSLARNFGAVTIAESVETPEEAAFLATSGVDFLQGYAFGAPSVVAPREQLVKRTA